MVERNEACDQKRVALKPTGFVLHRLPRPVDCGLELPQHEVRYRQAVIAIEDARVARIGAYGDFIVGNRILGQSGVVEDRGEAAVGKRAVRVDLDRAL